MAHEIERKYLLRTDAWKSMPFQSVSQITQGYVPDDGSVAVRIAFPAIDTADIRFSKGAAQYDLRVQGPDIAADFRKVATLPQYDAATQSLHMTDSLVCRIRSRKTGALQEAFLTIKAPTARADVTNEFEIAIPYDTAEKIMHDMTIHTVRKTRHVIDHSGQKWEVDVFAGALKGLVMAEAEVADIAVFDRLDMLPGIGADVTQNRAYTNRALGEYGLPKP